MKNKLLFKIVVICALVFIIYLFYNNVASDKKVGSTVSEVSGTEIIVSSNGQTAIEQIYGRVDELKTNNLIYEAKAMSYKLDITDNTTLLKEKSKVEDLASFPMMTSDFFKKYNSPTNDILLEVEQVNIVSSLTQPAFNLHNLIFLFDRLFSTPEIYFESTDHSVKEDAINKIIKTWNEILITSEAIKKTVNLESVKKPKLKLLFSDLFMSIDLIDKNCFGDKVSASVIGDSDKLTKYLLKLNKDSLHEILFSKSKVVFDFLIEHYTYQFARIYNKVPAKDRADVFSDALFVPETNENIFKFENKN